MADAQTATRSYADLPAELVRRIFAGAGDHKDAPLSVQDRLRAEAACRAWQQALRCLPFHCLHLGRSWPEHGREVEEAKQQWVVLAQPAATSVAVYATTELTMLALHCLDRKPLERLRTVDIEPRRVLPRPHIFPNLRHVVLDSLYLDPSWLEGLGQLPRLQRLELVDVHDDPFNPPKPCVVSGLSALTSLLFHNGDGAPALCVDLATLPALLDLEIYSDGKVELHTPQPAPSLRHLQLDTYYGAAMDYGALPALTSLLLGDMYELAGAAAIAGATSLRCLGLGGGPEDNWVCVFNRVHPWVLQLLRHAPPSLRRLHLHGYWEDALSEVVTGLTQLRVLSFHEDWHLVAPAVPGIGDGPVWECLCALHWASRLPIPEAVRRATRLEVLHLSSPEQLPQYNLHLLSSLPALRHLRIGGPWTCSAEAEAGAVVDLAHTLLPRLESVGVETGWQAFANASAGFLLD